MKRRRGWRRYRMRSKQNIPSSRLQNKINKVIELLQYQLIVMQPNQYLIHLDPSRMQEVQHYHSSLDVPTLQNIESRLEAQRIKNHQIGAAYFQQKYGHPHRYQDIIKATGYQPPTPEPPTVYQPNLYSVSGNKEYQQFLKNVLKEKQKEIEENIKNEALKPKAKQNPWVEEKKVSVKPQEVKYVSQFQKFRENKHKKEQVEAPVPKKKKKNYKRELIIKMFREMDTNSTGYIDKGRAIQYLKGNVKILQVCDLEESQIAGDIYSYESENSEKFKINEFLEFFGESGNVENLRESVHYSKLNTKETLLTHNEFRLFEEIFKSLDPYNDLIIKRKAFLQALRVNPEVEKWLLKPALKQPSISRQVTLHRILQRIDIEEEFVEDEEKKIKEYIYFNQFLKYFESQYRWEEEGNSLKRVPLERVVSYLNQNNPENLIMMDRLVGSVLTEALAKTEKRGSYFLFEDVHRNVQKHGSFKQAALVEVRAPVLELGTKAETFEDVMNRISMERPRYFSLFEVLEYFGERGYPVDTRTKVIPIQQKTEEQTEKARKQIRFQEPKEIDGYDSDPEIYQSGVYTSHKKLDDNFRGTFVSIIDDTNGFSKIRAKSHAKSQGRIAEGDATYQPPDVFRITVPQPFSFQNRELLNQKKKFKEESHPPEETDKGSSFKAKEIPKEVLEVGLYDKINENNEKRRENMKKMSMLASLAVEKPFGFLTREPKARKKNQEERKEFVFKSKPVPWFCKPDVYKEKASEEERLRRERVEKMAHQSLVKSKLPPRMERHVKEEEMKKEEEQRQSKTKPSQNQFKAKNPPDFSKIHKQFGEKLEKNKQSKQLTVVAPFALTETKVSQPTSQPQIKQEPKRDPVQYARKLNSTQPKLKAGSTLKYQDQVQKRRRDLQSRAQKQQQKNRIQKSLFQQDVKIKLLRQKQIQESSKKVDKRREQNKQRVKQQDQDYKKWKSEVIERAKAQPLLYERPLKRDEQLERMKKLYAMSEIIKANVGDIKEKDRKDIFTNTFTKEEQNLIKDYEYLLKNKKV